MNISQTLLITALVVLSSIAGAQECNGDTDFCPLPQLDGAPFKHRPADIAEEPGCVDSDSNDNGDCVTPKDSLE